MSKDNVITFKNPSEKAIDPLMTILREGAQQLLAQALETEITLFKAAYEELRLADNSPQIFSIIPCFLTYLNEEIFLASSDPYNSIIFLEFSSNLFGSKTRNDRKRPRG